MTQIVMLICLLVQTPQEPPAPKPDMWAQVRQLIGAMQQFQNWDEQYSQMMDAVETVFVAQGWDSEPDQFSLKMIQETEAIPPWHVQERFDKFTSMIADRLQLDDSQVDVLRQIMIRDSTQLFARNGDKIMSYAIEAIQTRAAGEPFTPEQVARWSKLAEPVIQDARKTMESSTKEFMQHLKPEQQAKVQADFDALNKRADRLNEMSKDWKAGKWNPSEWGMANDPIQNRASPQAPAGSQQTQAGEAVENMSDDDGKRGAEDPRRSRAERESAAPGSANPPPAPAAPAPPGNSADPAKSPAAKPDAGPNDPWANHVRDFIRRYKLEDDQQQKAWLFYKDAIQRRDAAAKAAAKPTTQPQEKESVVIGRIFERLKQRLEILPTRAQRKAAEAAPKPSPAPPPKK